MAEPNAILADVRAQRLINLAEPTAVILAMVLHFFDAATASDIVAAFARAVSPGSYLILSVGSGDEQTGDALAREYQAGTLYNHSLKQISAFVEDLELVPPGLTDAMTWIPGSPSQSPPPQSRGRILAGVARKPSARTQAFPRTRP
jgi:S-adenosyl methyltransferase